MNKLHNTQDLQDYEIKILHLHNGGGGVGSDYIKGGFQGGGVIGFKFC